MSTSILRLASLLVLAFTCLPSLAVAQPGGMDLNWSDCAPWGHIFKEFACDANTGSNVLYGAAVAPKPVQALQSMTADLVLTANSASLPPWWNFDLGCRAGPPSALSVDFNFLSGPFNCYDAWAGTASGGFTYTSGSPNPNQARLHLTCSTSSPQPLDGVSEYYLFKVAISNANTTGAGSCAGCQTAVCIFLRSIELFDSGGTGTASITNPLLVNYVLWQATQFPRLADCPTATPVRNMTWGAIKSFYR